jgi:hypothetical protein
MNIKKLAIPNANKKLHIHLLKQDVGITILRSGWLRDFPYLMKCAPPLRILSLYTMRIIHTLKINTFFLHFQDGIGVENSPFQKVGRDFISKFLLEDFVWIKNYRKTQKHVRLFGTSLCGIISKQTCKLKWKSRKWHEIFKRILESKRRLRRIHNWRVSNENPYLSCWSKPLQVISDSQFRKHVDQYIFVIRFGIFPRKANHGTWE